MAKNYAYGWYKKLKKPPFAPPSWVFGVVWTILYPIIIISFAYAFYLIFQGKLPALILIPLLLNIVTNVIFTPIQFRLRNNMLAAVDISIVILSLIWFMNLVYPYVPFLAYIQLPYLAWGSFATILQFSVTYLNRKR